MQLRYAIISFFLLLGGANICSGQGLGGIPFLKPGGLGLGKSIAAPTIKDFNQFGNGYAKHLKMLDRRSEKAYRKSFLKFLDTENELLYSLCETDEFKANMLLRSASASFGKMEFDRQRHSPAQQQDFSHNRESLHKIANATESASGNGNIKAAEVGYRENQMRYATNLYSTYMRNRLLLYEKSFKDGTKDQKKLLLKLKRREYLWRAYKEEDNKLTSDFSNKHQGLINSVQGSPQFARPDLKIDAIPDISKLISSPNTLTTSNKQELMSGLKEKLSGLLPENTLAGNEKVANVTNLFKEITALKNLSADSSLSSSPEKNKMKDFNKDRTQTKRFWDKVYGGFDAGVEQGTRYYPTGLRLTGTGGYSISKNSGLNLELSTVFNGEKIGFNTNEYLHGQVVSNYTAGANLDYRIWKVFFAGAGTELIVNQIEAPVGEFIRAQRYATYAVGVPVIFKALLPVSGKNSTTIEFRYDINNKNNVKPQFDFRVGFLIGRR